MKLIIHYFVALANLAFFIILFNHPDMYGKLLAGLGIAFTLTFLIVLPELRADRLSELQDLEDLREK